MAEAKMEKQNSLDLNGPRRSLTSQESAVPYSTRPHTNKPTVHFCSVNPSDNISAIYFTSQMGFGSQGHASWKADGLKRHRGHCGHNESAYVCGFAALSPSHSLPSFFFFSYSFSCRFTGATICICWLTDIRGALLRA